MADSGPRRAEHDPGTAAVWSLLLLGAGHAYSGLWGQAIARGVVSLWEIAIVMFSAWQVGRSVDLDDAVTHSEGGCLEARVHLNLRKDV